MFAIQYHLIDSIGSGTLNRFDWMVMRMLLSLRVWRRKNAYTHNFNDNFDIELLGKKSASFHLFLGSQHWSKKKLIEKKTTKCYHIPTIIKKTQSFLWPVPIFPFPLVYHSKTVIHHFAHSFWLFVKRTSRTQTYTRHYRYNREQHWCWLWLKWLITHFYIKHCMK